MKFIGDAMLAIFALPDGNPSDSRDQAACRLALDAAASALAGMGRANAERAAWGQPTLKCGIAVDIGNVMYGNIGAPGRLDFTVIGPAVNLVIRIEGLCKRFDRPVLTSAGFAGASDCGLLSLGWHPVKGLPDPIEVFGLPE
jgi:adenylate cyclase